MERVLKSAQLITLLVLSFFFSSILMSQSSNESMTNNTAVKVEYEVVHEQALISEDTLFIPDIFTKLSDFIQSKISDQSERDRNNIKDFVYETKVIGKEIFAIIDQKATPKDLFFIDKCYTETDSAINKKEGESVDLTRGELPSEEKKVESQKAEGERRHIQQIEELFQRNRGLFMDLFRVMLKHNIFSIIFQGSDISDFSGRDHGWLPIEPFVIFKRGDYFYLNQTLLYFEPGGNFCKEDMLCHSCLVEGDPLNYCVGLAKSKCKGETVTPLIYSEVYGRSKITPLVYMKLRLSKKLPIGNEKWLSKGCSGDVVEQTMPYYAGIRVSERDVTSK